MPIFMFYIFKIVEILISGWHITPQVKYAVFRAPIVIIGSLIWIEIGTQNNSSCFMRIQVADKAMADANRHRICITLPDQQNQAKAYCCNISFHGIILLISSLIFRYLESSGINNLSLNLVCASNFSLPALPPAPPLLPSQRSGRPFPATSS